MNLQEVTLHPNIRLYIEDVGRIQKPRRLSDQEYAAAIEAMIIVCADAVPINREHKTVYLTKRSIKPIKGWWIIGGRIPKGQTDFAAAMVANFRRETKLELSTDRFGFVDWGHYIWKDREQEPQAIGSHNFCATFTVELNADELQFVSDHLTTEEYEEGRGLHEFTRRNMIEKGICQTLIDLYDKIFPVG